MPKKKKIPRDKLPLTIESKVIDSNVYAYLEKISERYAYIERTLFNDLTNAPIIDNDFWKRLKSEYQVAYSIQARWFNALWSETKGKLESQKELFKTNQEETNKKLKELKKDIKEYSKWLKKGYKQKKTKPLKPHEIKKIKYGLHRMNQKKNRLEDKLKKEFKPSIVFGTRKFYKKQWTDEKYKDDKMLWQQEWLRKRNNNFFVMGSKDESNGNQICQYMTKKMGKKF